MQYPKRLEYADWGEKQSLAWLKSESRASSIAFNAKMIMDSVNAIVAEANAAHSAFVTDTEGRD